MSEEEEITTTERTLDERYESVHQAILTGPYREVQELVDNGMAWRLEGAVGRMVQAALRSGAAVLPPHQVKDFYGVTVPSYYDVEDEPGSPGQSETLRLITGGECPLLVAQNQKRLQSAD